MMSSDAPPPPSPVVEEGGVNLEDLKRVIHSLAESIKSLKSSASGSSPTDRDAISASVSALLNAKRTYAASNGGIDVDGKTWEEPMSKSEKKRLEKESKQQKKMGGTGAAAAPGGEGGGGGADANNANRPTEGEREKGRDATTLHPSFGYIVFFSRGRSR